MEGSQRPSAMPSSPEVVLLASYPNRQGSRGLALLTAVELESGGHCRGLDPVLKPCCRRPRQPHSAPRLVKEHRME